MTANASPGSLRRILTTLGTALKRRVLGKSTREYTKQLSGSDQYWNAAIAAQAHWHRKHPPIETGAVREVVVNAIRLDGTALPKLEQGNIT